MSEPSLNPSATRNRDTARLGEQRFAVHRFSVMLAIGLGVIGCSRDENDIEPPDEARQIQDQLENLLSVPYLSVTENPVETTLANVIINEPGETSDGFNFYLDRTNKEVRLIDMTGRLVHSWRADMTDLPDWALLMPDGGIILVDKFDEVIRLSVNSDLIWRTSVAAHHEVTLSQDKTFVYVATREIHEHRGLRVRFPGIATITLDGEVTPRWSGYDSLDQLRGKFDTRSFLDTIIGPDENPTEPEKRIRQRARILGSRDNMFDYFHLNTINLLPKTPHKVARFREGNLLVCFRNINQIAVMDSKTFEIVWSWGEGILDAPHYPVMLDNGRILVFDNGFVRGHSRVLEMDPMTGDIKWLYGESAGEHFFTQKGGCAQRLANGNTLITNTYNGEVFEVTPDKQVVWTWLNPAIVDERRGTVFRMLRYPSELVSAFLDDRTP